MSRIRFYLALWISKVLAVVIGLIAKGRGTNKPGEIALAIDPQFIKHIKGINPDKAVFITGTNGKSSTSNLLYHILSESGKRVIFNKGGANMTPGVAVPLLKSCSLFGRIKCDFIIMETDERYISRIRKQLPAKYLAITNIQKDQVQRNGEPSFIRGKIRDAITPEMTVFLNNDEPNSLSLTSAGAERAIRYSVARHERSFVKAKSFFEVTMPCPVCHSSLAFHSHNMENIGTFSCSSCGFKNDGEPDYRTTEVSFEDKHFVLNGNKYPFGCNRTEFLYSYTLAVSIALELGICEKDIQRTLETYDKNVGQGELHSLGKSGVRYFRIKQENSETLQSALSTLAADRKDKVIIMGLDEYIDFHPPYINGCYMFDCSFGALRDSGVEKCICTAPSLGRIAALRFLYDDFDPSLICTLPDSDEKTLEGALPEGFDGSVYLIEEIPFWKR